jgi:prepilin-type N-terminal cleavage/methylation domain-containing protein
MKKQGFTLIELLVVVAIIAIIAAIAIPKLLSASIASNETAAIGGLRTLINGEATWQQADSDCNGIRDYWCYDVSCLYRMLQADGTVKVEGIGISIAKADNYPALQATLGATAITANLTKESRNGYLYGQIAKDLWGNNCVQNQFQRGTTPATLVGSNFTWAIAATPEVYARSGVKIFIISQSGSLYTIDPGGQANVWAIGGAGFIGGAANMATPGTNKWPGDATHNDPAALSLDGTETSSPKWSVIE